MSTADSTSNAPRFETRSKPLFRDRDQGAMLSAFDLRSYDGVKANTDRVLATVRGAAMPRDDPWPEGQVELLGRWVDGETPRVTTSLPRQLVPRRTSRRPATISAAAATAVPAYRP